MSVTEEVSVEESQRCCNRFLKKGWRGRNCVMLAFLLTVVGVDWLMFLLIVVVGVG